MNCQYVLISGANGMLGKKITETIINDGNCCVLALVRNKTEFKDSERIIYITYEEFYKNSLQNYSIKAVIHLAFARANKGNLALAQSVEMSSQFLKKIKEFGLDNIIYISSQSVYGTAQKNRIEDVTPEPSTTYAMAKYSVEKMMDILFLNECNYCCIRMDSVVQSQTLIYKLCEDAKKKGALEIIGGEQVFSYIDLSDAALAISRLVYTDKKWKKVYNVGIHKGGKTLLEIANMVKEISDEVDKKNVEIKVTNADLSNESGMDTTRFFELTGWKPSIDLYSMIKDIYIND